MSTPDDTTPIWQDETPAGELSLTKAEVHELIVALKYGGSLMEKMKNQVAGQVATNRRKGIIATMIPGEAQLPEWRSRLATSKGLIERLDQMHKNDDRA